MRVSGGPRQPNRLAAGGRIDRGRAVAFRFDARTYSGYAGDTLASALLANGRVRVASSIKYHRPRGIVAAGVEEPNAIVQLGSGAGTVPNLCATTLELFEGLEARSLNRWTLLGLDVGRAMGLLGGVLAAGFYYRTFIRPRPLWPLYERLIRGAAGLGDAPSAPDPDVYDARYAHCDVLVIGAGPAGLAAAAAAGTGGARVLLVDERPETGGSLHDGTSRIDGAPAAAWVEAMIAAIRGAPQTRVLTRATCFGYYDHNFLAVLERRTDHLPPAERRGPRERLWRIRARRVVLATGSFERPLVFAGNDRPGVMLASAAAAYVHRYAVLPGRRIVLATNHDGAYDVAERLVAVGAEVTIVDSRPHRYVPLVAEMGRLGIEVLEGMTPVEANGRTRVTALSVARCGEAGRGSGPLTRLPCDLVLTSGGWSPALHLHAQSGGRAEWSERIQAFVPGRSVQAERSAGACAGDFELARCIEAGFTAGAEAACEAGFPVPPSPSPPPAADGGRSAEAPMPIALAAGSPRLAATAFVDFQNDTTAADIALAVREGFESVEHVKRYTALGFGTDQGKLGNVNGALILAAELGIEPREVGTTTFRPAYTPVTFGALAGRDAGVLFDPVRKTALHAWHGERGAVFEPVGQWLRPRYYPLPGEDMPEAVARETRAVRTGVGLLDASTLGKIDVQGRDAAEFLDRMFTNGRLAMTVGRCRYGLMLGEDGMVMDDGVTTRIGEHHFLVSTTTGGAAGVLGWLDRWHQTEWPSLEVHLTSVTEQWATLALAGPRSREVLRALCRDEDDLAPAAFPFMSVREAVVAGVPARLGRISFSGELGFEVEVPANLARHVWEALFDAGRPHAITPYGTEAMHVLRAEKGFFIVGQDTDGSVSPVDLGLELMCSRERDFIGKRSLTRTDCRRPDRKQLVGLRTEDPRAVLAEGSQLVSGPFTRTPVRMLGHVSSSYWSECLGHSIALALLEGGRGRHGERLLAVAADGEGWPVRVVAPVFYDPQGHLQHG